MKRSFNDRKVLLSSGVNIKLGNTLNEISKRIDNIDKSGMIETKILYGSYARGEEEIDSDIDIAIVVDECIAKEDRLSIDEELMDVTCDFQLRYHPLYVHFLIYKNNSKELINNVLSGDFYAI